MKFKGNEKCNIIACFVWLLQTVSSVEWHRKGDYLSTVMPADILFSVLLNILFICYLTCMNDSHLSMTVFSFVLPVI